MIKRWFWCLSEKNWVRGCLSHSLLTNRLRSFWIWKVLLWLNIKTVGMKVFKCEKQPRFPGIDVYFVYSDSLVSLAYSCDKIRRKILKHPDWHRSPNNSQIVLKGSWSHPSSTGMLCFISILSHVHPCVHPYSLLGQKTTSAIYSNQSPRADLCWGLLYTLCFPDHVPYSGESLEFNHKSGNL